jgi:hypothetical protein
MTTILITITITLLLRMWSIPAIRDGIFQRVGKLPTAVQWLAPLTLAILAAAGQGWLNGLRGTALLEEALKSGGEIGAMAIGLWHTAKRTNGGLKGLLNTTKRLLAKPVVESPTTSVSKPGDIAPE